MDNKLFNHLSRHRVGYLIAALTLSVAGLSSLNTVPNFYAPHNTLTGNVGELSAGTVMISENNASNVFTTNDKVTAQWSSPDTTAMLYLVPEDQTLKTIQISLVNGQSYQWSVPSNIATGNYYFGVVSNNVVTKGNMPFTIVNTANKSNEEVVSELKNTLSAYTSRIQSAQKALANYNTQISQAELNVNAINNEVAQLSNDLNEASAYYYKVKSTLSAEQDRAEMEKINNLRNELNQKTVDLANAQAYWNNLKAQAQSTQATVASLQATMTGIEAKINTFQGLTTTLATTAGFTAGSAGSTAATTNEISTPVNDPLPASAAEYALILAVYGVGDTVTVDDLAAAITVEESTLDQLAAYYNAVTAQKRASDLEVSLAEAAYNKATNDVNNFTTNLRNAQQAVTDIQAQMSKTTDRTQLSNLQTQLDSAQKNVDSINMSLKVAQSEQQSTQERLSTGKKINSSLDDALADVTSATQTVQSTLNKLTTKLNEVKSQGALTLSAAEAVNNYYKPYSLSSTLTAAEVSMAISTQQNLLEQLNEQAKGVAIELSEAQKEVSLNQADLSGALAKMKELTATMEAYSKQITDVTNQMSSTRDEKALATLKNQLNGVQTSLNQTVSLSLTSLANVQSAQQRLSTGLRVNSAKDNAAAQIQLAISAVQAELSELSTLSNKLSNGTETQGNTSTVDLSNGTTTTGVTMIEFGILAPSVTSTETSTDALTSGQTDSKTSEVSFTSDSSETKTTDNSDLTSGGATSSSTSTGSLTTR